MEYAIVLFVLLSKAQTFPNCKERFLRSGSGSIIGRKEGQIMRFSFFDEAETFAQTNLWPRESPEAEGIGGWKIIPIGKLSE